MNLHALLQASEARHGDKVAIHHGDRPFLTYRQLLEQSLSLAAALRDRGAARQDRVMIASENCPEYPLILFAIWAAGLVAVPVNAKSHEREFREILSGCGASLVFASPGLTGIFIDTGPHVIEIGGTAYREMLSRTPAICDEAQPDDVAWLFHTSGTTGRPKAAMLTHRNLLNMSVSHLADFEPLEAHDCVIHAAPMSHGSGMMILPYVLRGASQIIPMSGGFDPTEFFQLCAHHGSASAFMAPTMLRRLRLYKEATGAPVSGLRSVIYGGGPMYLEEIKHALAAFGPILTQLYGQGECPMTITGLRAHEHAGASDAVLSSVGWPRTGVSVRVVGSDGRELRAGEIGEIVCKSDIVMRGYWNDPDATAVTVRDCWLCTGDMGCFDERGMLTLKDRSKDVIISGGSNIYPREVEDILLTHPDVLEACVVGEPDPEWGENVVAFVVARSESKLGPEQLDAHCLGALARFKRPKRYVFRQSLPKSAYGKILKKELLASNLPGERARSATAHSGAQQ